MTGLGVHPMISVLIGLGLAVPFENRVLTSYARGAVAGPLYGTLWWALCPLLLMTLAMMGMPTFMIHGAALMSLMGHMLYGITLGLVATAVLLRRR